MGSANVAVSPDGQRLALVLSLPDKPPQLFVRPLDALALDAGAGGESGFGPFWSPDSRQIAFWGPTGLRSVDLAGGAAQVDLQGVPEERRHGRTERPGARRM